MLKVDQFATEPVYAPLAYIARKKARYAIPPPLQNTYSESALK